MTPPSLFVVSLPCSLSSPLYHAIRLSLGLREPEWTRDGDILDVRRSALVADDETVEGVQYVERFRDGRRFASLRCFLNQVARAKSYAYKDAVQPFLVAEWLATSGMQALYLDRPVADVAHALLERGWHFPARAGGLGPGASTHGVTGGAAEPGLERALLRGLLRARQALAALPVRVCYDELIHDEKPLWSALRALYGDDLPCPSYLNDDFCRTRDAALDRRRTARHRRLAELCAELDGA